MSVIGKIFGFKKAITKEEAIRKLREAEEMLVKKQDFLETKIKQELGLASENRTKNKRMALRALIRKKRYEEQLQQVNWILSTIMQMQREATIKLRIRST